MPIEHITGTLNVLDATKIRIKNVFETGSRIYMSFSSGKDSLCMASITYDLIMNGEINPKQLVVLFIDEEGLYPSMVKAAERWRKNFLEVGAQFLWFCLPFKQVCVLDSLSASESWITWDPREKDKWIRQPPPYAIMSHPFIKQIGEMNYQTFCNKLTDGIHLVGIRTAESLTRLQVMSKRDMNNIESCHCFYPIYDWKDSDVWKYIKDRDLEFPEIYIRLYESGTPKRNLRLCAFFGDCGTNGLIHIAETDPQLWEKIQQRMPNAYLALLYWDSEMFRRTSKKRQKREEEQETKDYKDMLEDLLFRHPEKYTIAKDTQKQLPRWRNFYIKFYGMITDKQYKRIYESILYGDPKGRVMRIMYKDCALEYRKRVSRETKNGGK